MMPAAELAGRQLGVEDASAVERAEEPADSGLAGDRVDAHLAELGAVGVHRPLAHLDRRWRGGLDAHLVALSAGEDRGVALAPFGLVELAEAAVGSADLVRLETRERRVAAGQLEQLGYELALRGDHRAADRGGLMRSAGQDDAGVRRVAVRDGHLTRAAGRAVRR